MVLYGVEAHKLKKRHKFCDGNFYCIVFSRLKI